ncbi:ROK family transcriptional regulator [Sphingobium sufflavum]|uniref:ROK family transcriptional regulator n=1 Tax=Sphingobium sufflavum TaxID=1129547 RepID=UPI001F446CFE|nr:ROK family transcriptional regulator [Sphingobium sufflavum]MCE7797215.1 ROK family transcriptional regulator [Sphingobium sufflavum]
MRLSDSEYHRLTVLKNLRAAEPVSRTELAQLSGLTGGAITPIVRDLAARGLVLEEKVPSPNRGRPRVNLRLNPAGAYVAAATLPSTGDFLVEILDLTGRAIFSQTRPLTDTRSLAVLAAQFATVLAEVIAASPLDIHAIAQVGIGLPAMVDNRTGVVEYMATFSGGRYDFAATLQALLGIPVRIDNNMNLLARAEHWFGASPPVDDFTLILIELGLGGARYQNGQLVVGSHGIEAELGHTKIVPEDGRQCHCGGFGCLQTYSSLSALVTQYCDLTGQAVPGHMGMRSLLPDVIALTKAGHNSLQDIFHRCGKYLGIAIANHINMQDPERIIVLSSEPELVDLISDDFFDALHHNTLEPLRNLARVTFRHLDEQNYSRGAAAMVLEQLYQSRTTIASADA